MTTKIKILIAVALLLTISGIVFGIYYTYFQFNQKDVKDYINEEVEKYPLPEQAGIYKIINDGVTHILNDRYEVSQVLERAKLSGTPREMELVHAAIMDAKNKTYLSL
jgi:hypothetical protein